LEANQGKYVKYAMFLIIVNLFYMCKPFMAGNILKYDTATILVPLLLIVNLIVNNLGSSIPEEGFRAKTCHNTMFTLIVAC
jgi:hypothetical protein